MKSPTPRECNQRALWHLAATALLASTIASHAIPTAADSFLTDGSDYATGTTNLVGQGPVTTGLELCIDLADLGNPAGPIKVMLLQSNDNHNYISNQSLGGLPAGYGNLADPANNKDFSGYPGDQFFTVDPSPVHLMAGNTAIRFTARGLTIGQDYVVQESVTLAGFTDVPGSEFTATGSVQVITLPVSPGTDPKRFFRAKSVP